MIMLETRLDNVVFRMGFASSRKEARQLVRHGHFTVNGRKQDIPSFAVKEGDLVKVKERSTASPKFKEIRDMSISTPSWISVDIDKLEGKVLALPRRDDIDTGSSILCRTLPSKHCSRKKCDEEKIGGLA